MKEATMNTRILLSLLLLQPLMAFSAAPARAGSPRAAAASKASAKKEADEKCPICLCEWESAAVIIGFDCDSRGIVHKYHLDCISDWIQQPESRRTDSTGERYIDGHSCPLCRGHLKLLNYGDTDRYCGDHIVGETTIDQDLIPMMDVVFGKTGFAKERKKPAPPTPEPPAPGLFEKESLAELCGAVGMGLLLSTELAPKTPGTTDDTIKRFCFYVPAFFISQLILRKVNPKRTLRNTTGTWLAGLAAGMLTPTLFGSSAKPA